MTNFTQLRTVTGTQFLTASDRLENLSMNLLYQFVVWSNGRPLQGFDEASIKRVNGRYRQFFPLSIDKDTKRIGISKVRLVKIREALGVTENMGFDSFVALITAKWDEQKEEKSDEELKEKAGKTAKAAMLKALKVGFTLAELQEMLAQVEIASRA